MNSRLSRHGLAILRALAHSNIRLTCSEAVDPEGSGGALRLRELLRLHPSRPTVAKVCVSRTLRRLHRAGFVELFNADGWALSDKQAQAAARLHAAERDPAGTFAAAKALAADLVARRLSGLFFWQSPEEYLDDLHRGATARVRHQPMHFAQITPAGRQRLTLTRPEISRKSTRVDFPPAGYVGHAVTQPFGSLTPEGLR